MRKKTCALCGENRDIDFMLWSEEASGWICINREYCLGIV